MSCPRCPCSDCEAERRSHVQVYTQPQQVGFIEPEIPCAFERITKEYAARGEPMPTGWLLVCQCKRCSPICM